MESNDLVIQVILKADFVMKLLCMYVNQKTQYSITFIAIKDNRLAKTGADAIKKFTPNLVKSKIWEPLVTPKSGLLNF